MTDIISGESPLKSSEISLSLSNIIGFFIIILLILMSIYLYIIINHNIKDITDQIEIQQQFYNNFTDKYEKYHNKK
jgi:amino acid permease